MFSTSKKNEENAEEDIGNSRFEGASDNYPVNNSELMTEPYQENESPIDDVELSQNYANSRINVANAEDNEWTSPFTVKKSWNYRTALLEKPKRPKISAANRVKAAKTKKPGISILRNLKNDNSSPCYNKAPKRRPKNSKNDSDHAVRTKSSTVNGVIVNEKSVTSYPKVTEVPDESPLKRTTNDFGNYDGEAVADEEEEDDGDVPHYPQYVELKPSVKFKCYRCGMKNFSTMALLQEHMSKCSGKANMSGLSHSASSSASLRTTEEQLISSALASPDLKITRKVFLCSSCGTYYQNYNLYIHMRDKHNKQICLYCRNIFARSDQLWDHLVNAHNLDSVKFANVSEVRNVYKSSFYITCCSCNSIFSNEDRFSEHYCESKLDSNDVSGGTTDKEGAICLGCKSKDEAEATKGANNGLLSSMDTKVVAGISSPHKSVCSEEEADELNFDGMLRGSTLDVIGVPENHRVSSFNEEPISNGNDLTKIVERALSPVPDEAQSPKPEDIVQSPVPAERVLTPVPEDRAQFEAAKRVSSPVPEDCAQIPTVESVRSPVPEDRVQTLVAEKRIRSPVSEDHVQTSALVEHVQSPVMPEDRVENSLPSPNADVTEQGNVENRDEISLSQENVKPLPIPYEQPVTAPNPEEDAIESDAETDVLNIDETKPTRSDNDDASGLSEPTTVNTPDSRTPANELYASWPEETKSNILPDDQPSQNEHPQPLPMALMLDDAVATLSVPALIKECVRTSCLTCLYCNNATLIAVNAGHLVGHLVTEHRYMPTKNEDDSQKVVERLESGVSGLSNVYMNASHSTHRDIVFEGSFACLQCSFSAALFKDLCHHKRRAHHAVIFLCIMCKCNFLYYSQLLCHLCPGLYSPETQHSLSYHCCFCDIDRIPSAFRLMVHLRKVHQACDVCLSRFADQSELYSHMIKQHKINHLCYKCNLAWRSRDDISKHLFWKHGTESVLCKRCLQKKWPHAYHFCVPASTYTCDECSRIFTKAVALTVHRRVHNGEFPFGCEDCEQRFISKRLVALHRRDVHHVPLPPTIKESEGGDENENNEGKRVNGAVDGEREESKARRKKKRKRTKVDNEKPLLDELPPLNLSSESDDESPDEDAGNPAASTDANVTTANGDVIATAPPAEPTAVADTFAVEPIATDDTASVAEPIAAVDTTIAENSTTVSSPGAEVEKPAETAFVFSLPFLDTVPCETNESNPNKETPNEKTPKDEATDDTADNPAPENDEEKSVNMVEKMLNCLIIEHSYCIPDSIFRTEIANQSAVSESSDNANKQSSSPKPCTKRDKSCKSVTPRKRKRSSRRESSTSDTSSDSDSSSSSCGSNCSCNKSVSNCSSSSSSGSTTPEKSAKRKAEQTQLTQEEACKSDVVKQQSLLNVAEIDLETDITTSDEDFYEVHPYIAPPPQPATSTAAIETRSDQVTCPTFDTKITISKGAGAAAQPREKRTKKRRKKPRITINLGQIQRNSNAAAAAAIAKSLAMKSSQQIYPTSSYGGYSQSTSPSIPVHDSGMNSSVPNCMNTTNSTISSPFAGNLTPGTGSDNSGRQSKRKRVKNKFYGYSSSDEGSTNESFKTAAAVRKRASQHKRQPKHPFVGIQIKKPLLTIIPPKPHPNVSMSPRPPSLVSRPADVYRVSPVVATQHHYQPQRPAAQAPDTFRQQQHGFAKPFLPHSSDESSDDSDERRHTLVINLPNPRQKKVNNSYHPPQQIAPSSHYVPSGNDGLRRPDTWMAARAAADSFSSTGPFQQHQQHTPNKSEIYCFCKCPYDEVSEMIACDGPNCPIEWFHFECVGIMVPPKGKWFCPECRKNRENVTRFFD